MRGHGVVVTGTATAGVVRAGRGACASCPAAARRACAPCRCTARRSKRPRYGQRVALNLAGDRARRGAARPRGLRPRARSGHRPLRRLGRAAPRGAAARCASHTPPCGSTSAPPRRWASIVWLDGRAALAPKESALAQLVLREPIAAFGGDRFILRDADRARAPSAAASCSHPVRAAAAPQRDPRLPSWRRCATRTRRSTASSALLDTGGRLRRRARRARRRRQPARRRGARAPAAPARRAAAARRGARRGVHDAREKWQRLRAAVAPRSRRHPPAHSRASAGHGDGVAALAARRRSARPRCSAPWSRELEREAVLVREESVVRLPGHRGRLDRRPRRRSARRSWRASPPAALTPPDVRQLAAELGDRPVRASPPSSRRSSAPGASPAPTPPLLRRRRRRARPRR